LPRWSKAGGDEPFAPAWDRGLLRAEATARILRYASRIVVVKGEKHGSATSLLSLMKVGCSQGDRIAVP
jgi:hypothetical protein